MQSLFYIFLIIIIIVILYFVYQIIIWYKTRVPYIKTRQDRLDLVFSNLEVVNKNVYELGCGTADFLFQAEKRGAKKSIGYELSFYLCLLVWIKRFFTKSKVQIKCQNFFTADITDADIIYLFLVDKIVQKIWLRIKSKIKPGTIVVVLADKIHDVEPYRILDIPNSKTKIYFYK